MLRACLSLEYILASCRLPTLQPSSASPRRWRYRWACLLCLRHVYSPLVDPFQAFAIDPHAHTQTYIHLHANAFRRTSRYEVII